MIFAAARIILSLALGRENVVHAALTDPAAASRVRHALARWRAFTGPERGLEGGDPASRTGSAEVVLTKNRMADQTTDKPKLGTRPPLGIKRTVETGKVKQSFSHGRSNTVVVEVKKRQFLGRPGEAPPPEAPKPEPVAEAPKPAPKPVAPAPRKPSAQDEISDRKELQQKLLREAEGARLVIARGSAAPRRACP